jgi:acetyl-CoA carboxylase beta subunit
MTPMSSSWLEKILPNVGGNAEDRRTSVPEGLWRKCPKCDAALYKPELDRSLNVCPKCDHHMRINARERIDLFLDAEGREELAADWFLPIVSSSKTAKNTKIVWHRHRKKPAKKTPSSS